MAKMSKELRELRQQQQLHHVENAPHNFLPEPGVPYGEGIIASSIMIAVPATNPLMVNVEYVDEFDQVQRRLLGGGTWRIKTKQINGYTGYGAVTGDLIETLTESEMQISVFIHLD